MYRPPTPEQRFWEKVVGEVSSGCCVWTGAKLPFKNGSGGYGVFHRGMKNGRRDRVYAHRYAYEIEVGPIGDGLIVMHSCDNRLCVRKEHLSLGTDGQNFADMRARGRHPIGVRAPNAKLDDDKVRAIRKAYAETDATLTDLAARYGISFQLVSQVARRKIWKHVT